MKHAVAIYKVRCNDSCLSFFGNPYPLITGVLNEMAQDNSTKKMAKLRVNNRWPLSLIYTTII